MSQIITYRLTRTIELSCEVKVLVSDRELESSTHDAIEKRAVAVADSSPDLWSVRLTTNRADILRRTPVEMSRAWPRCANCNHIAQDHNLDGSCGPLDPTHRTCTCPGYVESTPSPKA